jgi:quinol monooxygenase YgiN
MEDFNFCSCPWNRRNIGAKKKGITLLIHSTIRMNISPKKEREALEILRSITERTKAEPGCISCRIYRDIQEKDAITIEELWRRQEELERHLRSSDYRSLLMVVEMAKRPPEIRFSVISEWSGVETIEKARGNA